MSLHPSARKVAAAASALGLEIQVVEFEQTTRTAEEAASAIGCQVGQIVKSLLFLADGRPVMALVSGDNRLDQPKLAALLDTHPKKVRRPKADQVKAITGFTIGGVPPFGHQQPLAVYVDEDLMVFETVWAAAGTPFAVFAISPKNLVAASQGVVSYLKVD